ncbi:hypothetical protein [Streptomyces sp. NPDC047009]|uniref:hypothetical protein n=1 Tax=Streptomyces sp. NPDC047009 TaxID=3154496 RepID=UPI003404A11D
MATHDPSGSRWIVLFSDTPYAMRILAVEAAPEDPDAYDEMLTDAFVNCLSAYEVDAASSEQARRTARQLHEVERIRIVCERRHALRARRHPVPHRHQALAVAGQALAHAAQDLQLPRQAIRYADAMATAALRSGYQHRAWPQRELTFAQYANQIPATAAATLHRYAALVVMGRTQEAVALLVNTLAASASDL